MAVLQHLFVRATTEELVLQFASIASKLQKSSENEVDPELSRAKEAIASHALFDLTQDYAKLAANLLLIPETQLESHFTLLLALIFKVTEKEKEDTQQTLLLQHVLKSLLNSTYEKGSMKLRLYVEYIFIKKKIDLFPVFAAFKW
ncbi:hypothetical protein HMI56_000039 [Coelomomyces lativittatus]|nr:hypothetical protein HMI56_000039 [Coelomomyces lativittatus]